MFYEDSIWNLVARKLSGEASAEEAVELQRLAAKDPVLAAELEMLEAHWDLEAPADAEFLEATYLLHRQRMEKQGLILKETSAAYVQEEEGAIMDTERNPSWVRRVGALALLASAVILSLLFFPEKDNSSAVASQQRVDAKEVMTENGTRTRFKLPDGTVVWLNAGSKLHYNRWADKGNREVYLTGEGFFDVVHNPQRPFIIHTNHIDIRVLGTKFNVKAYPDDKTVETSLIQGSVEVMVKDKPGEKYLLKPNQKLVLANPVMLREIQSTNLPVIRQAPPVAIRSLSYFKGDTVAQEAMWVRNRLVFEDEQFTEVAKKMERWYNISFEFKSRKPEDLRLTGSFEDETLEQAMQALQFTASFRYQITEDKVIIY